MNIPFISILFIHWQATDKKVAAMAAAHAAVGEDEEAAAHASEELVWSTRVGAPGLVDTATNQVAYYMADITLRPAF